MLQTQHFGCLLEDGTSINQSIPIVLAVTNSDKQRLENSSAISLYHNGICYAILRKPEFYHHRKEERCSRQFGTCHPDHPCIKVR